ncbi:MAG: HAD family phosphatase [Hydrogenophaga sp.]|uniref:HAD family hydrolase n=1 Tax=Hydrogenophaga sp. TaxID=1904254 RepID=UPI001D6436CC|nr:HAD family phosphatase [Hydrogenophaga sp.]MBX3609600.1 HAD family phosphatase [Hydrogenophaga sp.]
MLPSSPLPTLAMFDLDHTLLDGDGDDLWCRFMLRHGVVDASLAERNEHMGAEYRAGRVGAEAFSNFYAQLLAGHTPAHWTPWQDRFLDEVIRARLPLAARALVASHRDAGHTLLLTTASNRVIAERTAKELGFAHWIATELELTGGVFSGRIAGQPNMREGKLHHLHQWLRAQGLDERVLKQAWFYSDSINDLPLLASVGHPVATNPDAALLQHAHQHHWRVLQVLGGRST